VPVQSFGESVQAFKRRLSLGDDHVKEIKDALTVLGNLVQDVTVKARELNEVRLGEHASDAVLDRIDALFADEKSVGRPMEARELEDARAEAERRGREGIPPGYRDKNKVKGDPAGDYIIWRKVMDEAETRKLPVVFVTGDVKEDWYQREYGLTLGARRELREEMMREAGVPLLIMTTETFLRHAETYLGATVSEKTKDQAKELPSAADVIEVFVSIPKSVLIDWLTVAAADGRDISDLLLERIASGEIQGHRELRFAMQVLRTRFGGAEMMQRVVEAVNVGQRSGALGREEAAAVLSAVTRELQSSVETVTFLSEAKPRAANPAMPMRRAVFEHALKVSPASDDPDEAAQARRTIAMHLDRHQPTPDDRDRARAWLREHSEWTGIQRSESQEEPSAEDS
jgi:hypothetical protein